MAALDVSSQDALRAERTVVQALGVRVLQRLGDVAHDLQALGDGEAGAAVTQQVIQAHGLGVVVEDEGRTQLGVFVFPRLQYSGMVDSLKNFEFPAGRASARGSDIRARRGGYRVDAHTAVHGCNGDVLGFPILEAFAFGQQLTELVVTDLTVLVGRSDACLVEAARNRAGLLRVDCRCASVCNAVGQRADDAIVVSGARPTMLERRALGDAREPAGEAARRQEYRGLDERQPNLGLRDRRLALQQTGQALGFAVGQDERVVVGTRASVGGPGPAVGVAGENAGPALDLNEK
jgi:hypothetical protein